MYVILLLVVFSLKMVFYKPKRFADNYSN